MPLIRLEMNANRVYSVSDTCCYRQRRTYVFDGFISSPENIVYPVDLDGNDKSHPPLELDSVEQLRTFLIQKKNPFNFTISVRNKHVLSATHILKRFC